MFIFFRVFEGWEADDANNDSTATFFRLSNNSHSESLTLLQMDGHGSHRLPPSSSALLALSYLMPPSPILSSGHLSTAWTSEDVPILFDFDMVDSSGFSDPSVQAIYTDAADILPNSSVSTIEAIGTLGPAHRRNLKLQSGVSSTSHISLESETLVTEKTQSSFTSSYAPSAISYDGVCETRANQDQVDKFNFCYSIRANLLSPSRSIFAINQVSLSTPVSPHHSPDICSLAESPSDYNLHPLLPFELSCTDVCNGDLRGATPSETSDINNLLLKALPATQSRQSCPTSTRPRSPPDLNSNGDEPVDARARELAITATLASLEAKCYSAPSSPQEHRTTQLQGTRIPEQMVQKNLAGLRTTVVELLIDQEGFRRVLARFKYAGYVSKQSSGSQPGDIEGGLAQFRPTYRQAFNFHYAPIDGLPVLRRITLDGEESRDYISRQASLSLKSNGVYVVRGIETSSLPASYVNERDFGPFRGSETFKLHWRFEYLVDDRRIEVSGKRIVDGEKILTPLSFSCSPLLLHPLQGKRVRLMHVVKKTVITKLVAEKMEPPGSRSLSPVPPSVEPCRTPTALAHIQTTTAQLLTKSYVWNIHKRTKSHMSSDEQKATTQCDIPLLDKATGQSSNGARPPRRRRASSAGERSRPSSNILSNMKYHVCLPSDKSICPPGRHIIPPSRLAELLDEDTENVPLVAMPVASAPEVHAPFFLPLSPSPRHYQKRYLR